MLNIMRTGSDEYGKFIKALITGNPGAGKTLVSSTFPNPLYANVEGGLMSIADRKIPFVNVEGMDDIISIKNVLSQDKKVREKILGFPVDTVVIDTIDEVQNLMIQELLIREKKAKMAIQDWGKVADEMKALIRGFRNLDMNVVFTCHLKTMTDEEDGRSWYAPGLAGQMADKIPGMVDLSLMIHTAEVVEVTKEGTKKVDKRLIESYPTKQYPFLKDRSGKLPHSFEVNFHDDYARIQELIFGDMSSVPVTEEIAELFSEEEEKEAELAEQKTDEPNDGDSTETSTSSSAILAAKKLRG